MRRAVYQFASFALDLGRLSVFGPEGRVNLRPKSFDVLHYLLVHAGRIVAKEELITAVWPHVVVSDESLTRCISEIRRALGDGTRQIVKTVPRRGYLLDAAISAGSGVAMPIAQLDSAGNHPPTDKISGLDGQSAAGLHQVQNRPMRGGIARKILQFDHFALNLVRGCLQADGKDIELRPKTFEVLCHLAENAGRLVPMQELREVVWPRVVVSDDSLTQCVRELRKKLGDKQHRLIKMLPRRGYMLDATLRITTQTSDVEYNVIWEQQTADCLIERPSITVLPFGNMSQYPRYNHFAAGLKENIIAALSRYKWLFIVATDTKGQSNGHRSGRGSQTDYALRGTITHTENRLRVTVQLINARSRVLWAECFDGDVCEIFTLQDRITETVAAALEPTLESAELDRLKHKSICDLGPEELVLYAHTLECEFTEESYARAFRCLKQALIIDSSYAPALALEAFCRVFRLRQGWSTSAEEDAHEGYRLAIKALETGLHDPRVLSLSSLAVRSLGGDVYRGSELAYRALELNPNSVPALVNAGYAEVYAGNPAKALQLLGRAERINPRDSKAWYTAAALGLAYFANGQYQEGICWSKKALAQNSRFAPSLRTLTASLAKLGRVDDAAQVVPIILKQDPALTVEETHRQLRHMPESILSRWLEGLRIAGLPR